MQVPGHGLQLARDLFGNIPGVHQHLVAPDVIPTVGTLPPLFNNQFASYTLADVIHLVIFYNEDFGIAVNDSVERCVQMFHLFFNSILVHV